MIAKSYCFDQSFQIYAIRGLASSFHLLHDVAKAEAVLIDTGFIGEMSCLARILQKIGLTWHDIKAILLTHGHLDHTGNLTRLKQLTDASILAHALEQPHINGTFAYCGPSRVCGLMEAFGRWVLCYQPVLIGEFLTSDMELPYWGGLRVLHLPGHTEGHCGFYSQRFDLLFSGDLFASYSFSTHIPPTFLNSCPKKIQTSLETVRTLSPCHIIPNHYDGLDGKLHRKKFDILLKNQRCLQ